MSEETKLAKFRVILQELQNWLYKPTSSHALMVNRYEIIRRSGECYVDDNLAFQFGESICRLPLFDNYVTDSYVDSVLKTIGYCLPVKKTDVVTDAEKIIKAYKTPDRNEKIHIATRNCMVFWMLFLAALDDEIYNNELDSIIDIAYCMDFDEAMIRDWCRAVEYVMQGNRLQEGCDFPCETLEGARFFLHKDSSNSVLELLQ